MTTDKCWNILECGDILLLQTNDLSNERFK